MENFEKRRDRFEFFEGFENPLINITSKIEVTNFIPYCRERGLPVFHFFLFCVFKAALKTENFLYRIHDGKVIKISEVVPSYTVMNRNDVLNFTRFKYSSQRDEFIARSLIARDEAVASESLIHTGLELDLRTLKNYIFITSIPWLDFTSIQHPVYRLKSADIPSFAWGKFTEEGSKVTMAFSVQAHHGFVDGFHIHQLIENLKTILNEELQ